MRRLMPRDWLDAVDMESFRLSSSQGYYPDNTVAFGKRGGAECGTMDKGGSPINRPRTLCHECCNI